MANGFRITEAEDTRVTEEGDLRVTEGLFEGVVSLTAVAVVVAASVGLFNAEADLAATGSKLFAGERVVSGAVELSAISALQAGGDVKTLGNADLVGKGALTSEAVAVASGVVSLAGVGSLSVDSFFGIIADSSLAGTGTATFTDKVNFSGVFGPFFAEAVRTTEEEDDRITEEGDLRITEQLINNSGVGSLVVTSTKLPFASQPFVKVSDDWKVFTPYVKNNDLWQEPEAIYKKESGLWRRIY